nr:hypothetical protein [uncultured Rhodopila sp.]
MNDRLKPIPLVFWRSDTGREPVRDWLNDLPREDRRTIGVDIARVQFGCGWSWFDPRQAGARPPGTPCLNATD